MWSPTPLPRSLVGQSDEVKLWSCKAALVDQRDVKEIRLESADQAIQITDRVGISKGQIRGREVTIGREDTDVDFGECIVTSHRVIFDGGDGAIAVPWQEVMGIRMVKTKIRILTPSKDKEPLFRFASPEMAAMFEAAFEWGLRRFRGVQIPRWEGIPHFPQIDPSTEALFLRAKAELGYQDEDIDFLRMRARLGRDPTTEIHQLLRDSS